MVVVVSVLDSPFLVTPCIHLDSLVLQCPRYNQSIKEHAWGQKLFRDAFCSHHPDYLESGKCESVNGVTANYPLPSW